MPTPSNTAVITAVCVLFLIKLRWPRNKSLYDKGYYSLRQVWQIATPFTTKHDRYRTYTYFIYLDTVKSSVLLYNENISTENFTSENSNTVLQDCR